MTELDEGESNEYFDRYVRECQIRSRSADEKDSVSAWVTFFRVINRVERVAAEYELEKSKEFQPDNHLREACSHFLDGFSASSLSRYPWRLAVAELVIKFELDVATIAKPLGLLAARLERYPTWQGATDQEYVFHTILKKSGETRQLQEPKPWLKTIQRALYCVLRETVTPHPSAHGFERGRSIVSNAQVHCGQPIVIRMDIKAAFETTSRVMIEKALRRDLQQFQLSDRAISFLGVLFTYRGFLPTGAPSSPYLLNRVLLEADVCIAEAIAPLNASYSRYADDLIVSCATETSLMHIVRCVIQRNGYRINKSKTRLYRQGGRQIVTGLVVNERPNLPREVRKNLRAALWNWTTNGSATWKNEVLSEKVLNGHLNYFKMVNARAAECLLSKTKTAAGG